MTYKKSYRAIRKSSKLAQQRNGRITSIFSLNIVSISLNIEYKWFYYGTVLSIHSRNSYAELKIKCLSLRISLIYYFRRTINLKPHRYVLHLNFIDFN